ncbi:TRAP transporter substrate-binding protein DctP [Moorella sulfitireducens (nom. illeg.)]|uniref:TRAP transporter substrate-binding protein DctP n=1 Tax=Neomoorella sulfitireducens TaxID=2972948 RepID=UPI0021AC17F2|nr:TRAP transporter substrate-binding protein DctP [Moorella sulfitireducens]
MQIRRKWFTVVLICLTVVALVAVVAGCGKQQGATQQQSSQAPAEQPKTIELTINDHDPAESPVGQIYVTWSKWVNENSGGKVKVNVVSGGALLKGNEAFRGVQTGVVAGAHYVVDREDGFLLNLVTTMPFLGLPEIKESREIYKQLLDKFPQMKAEWKGVKILAVAMMPGTHFHFSKAQVKTLADIVGKKIAIAESVKAEVLSALKATPVEIDIADMYQAVERGMVDGVYNHMPVLNVFGVLPLLKNHLMFGEGGIDMTPMMLIMNEDTWNKLPDDVKKLLEESAKVWEETAYQNTLKDIEQCMKMAQDKGHSIVTLTPDEIEQWREVVKPVHDKWLKECADKGLPGQEVYNTILQLAGQVK